MTASPHSIASPGSAAATGSLASRFRALIAPGIRIFAAGELPSFVRRSLDEAGITAEPAASFDGRSVAEKAESLVLAIEQDLSSRADFIVPAAKSGAALLLVSLDSDPPVDTQRLGFDGWEIARFACADGVAGVSACLRICGHRAAAASTSAILVSVLAQRARERDREELFAGIGSTLASLERRLIALEGDRSLSIPSPGEDPRNEDPALRAMRETVLGLFSSLASASEERQKEMRRVASELAALRKNLEPALSLASAIRRLFSQKEDSL